MLGALPAVLPCPASTEVELVSTEQRCEHNPRLWDGLKSDCPWCAVERLRPALQLFLEQWNACGPNSEFGRYFANVRIAAEKALRG